MLKLLPIAFLPLCATLCPASTSPERGSGQRFEQEVAMSFTAADGLPVGPAQLVEVDGANRPRLFNGGRWYGWSDGRWETLPGLQSGSAGEFVLPDASGTPLTLAIPWPEVRQVVRRGRRLWVATEAASFAVVDGRARSLGWPKSHRIHQMDAAPDGTLWIASSGGLFRQFEQVWAPLGILDGQGRAWAVEDVRGVAWDTRGRLWFATRAGAGCREGEAWRFYEGRDGLPWNDFTGLAAGPGGVMWFGTRLGAIRFDGREWAYRQGPRWLPHDEVRQIAVDGQGNAWLATAGNAGALVRRPMTLAEKAEFYEDEIGRYIKRTPFGYVAEAPLGNPGDRSTAHPQDSDNDGLWTAMYGAGECFAYGATRDPRARERAQAAFEALRFLQKVTQGGPHAPPKGFIARTIRPADWPDPNLGRLEADREAQQSDRLWKVYEPRWPRSADGRWYWKGDTSSDELDGHFFFYPLYHDLCAETEAEKERVREVVRDVTDHLLANGLALVDHDGRPTRWAVFGPQSLNADPFWWPERGLNSLSLLSYLAAAEHVTGDPKYGAASRELIDRHGYAQNAMFAKVQQGPGSGNQSDDEMAMMGYYTLLRCSRDEPLKARIRYSFFHYWANEWPEMNPFFNFAYAAWNTGVRATNPYGTWSLEPWEGWLEDSLATLRGLPLDRLNWPLQNSHRLDVQPLPRQAATDLYEPGQAGRGHRVNGKVLPVENRHFNHWNTDPWRLDYGGNGGELAAGTVFLLPYYMGLYHGFIEKPGP